MQTTEPDAPQTEGGEAQTEPAKTYTQEQLDAEIKKAVSGASSVWAEERSRLKRSQSRALELESLLKDRPEQKDYEKMKADLDEARGKLSAYRTDIVSGKVASELSADAEVVKTIITGMRASGQLDREPEDPSEAASAWLDAIREKHGSFFTKPDADPKPEPEKRQRTRAGVIPAKDDTPTSPETAREERARAERRAGRRGVVI